MTDNPMVICFNEFVVEQHSPLCMEQFSMAMGEKAVARCSPTRVHCYEVLECIRELFVYLSS